MVNHPNRARIERRVAAEIESEDAKAGAFLTEQLRAVDAELLKYARYVAAMVTQRNQIEQQISAIAA